MASISRRGPGQWQARVRRNKRVVSKTFGSRLEAERWAADAESAILNGPTPPKAELVRMTFGEALEKYLELVTPLKKSRDTETYRIKAMQRSTLAQFRMVTISGRNVAEWRDERLKKVSGDTVNRDLNLISHVIEIARKEWDIPIQENPVSKIRRPKNNRARERRLSSIEQKFLLASLEVLPRTEKGTYQPGAHNPWFRPLVLLALETAMRRSELLALRWENVNLERRTARLLDTKNGDARAVPLSSRAAAVLTELGVKPSGRVFPITPDSVKKGFTRAVARAHAWARSDFLDG
jgi:integrase